MTPPPTQRRRWSVSEDEELAALVAAADADSSSQQQQLRRDWNAIADALGTQRTAAAVKQHFGLLRRRPQMRSASPQRQEIECNLHLRFGCTYRMTAEQAVFRRNVLRKLAAGYCAYTLMAIAIIITMGSPDPPESYVTHEAEKAWRRTLTFAAAASTCFWSWEALIQDPPPTAADNSWHFLNQCPVSKFIWLTVNISAVQLLYWALATLSELEVLLDSFPAWHWRLVSIVHASSVFVATLGFSLAALFLKFNYFEANWRRTVLEKRISRGIPARYYAFIGHMCALPLNVLDLLVIRDRFLLCTYTLSNETVAAVGLVYGFIYLGWINLNYRWSGLWPYPFCDSLFVSVSSQVGFALAIGVGCSLVSFGFRNVAMRGCEAPEPWTAGRN